MLLGCSWGVLGTHGVFLGWSWGALGVLGVPLGFLGVLGLQKAKLSNRFWPPRGCSWGSLGTCWGPLGASWGILGVSGGALGVLLGCFGGLLVALGVPWGAHGVLLGPLGVFLGPLIEVSTCIRARTPCFSEQMLQNVVVANGKAHFSQQMLLWSTFWRGALTVWKARSLQN